MNTEEIIAEHDCSASHMLQLQRVIHFSVSHVSISAREFSIQLRVTF